MDWCWGIHILRGRNDASQKKLPLCRERLDHRHRGRICADEVGACDLASRIELRFANIEPFSCKIAPNDRLLPDYQQARTFASGRRSETFPLLSAHKLPQNSAFRRAQRLAVPRAPSELVGAVLHACYELALILFI